MQCLLRIRHVSHRLHMSNFCSISAKRELLSLSNLNQRLSNSSLYSGLASPGNDDTGRPWTAKAHDRGPTYSWFAWVVEPAFDVSQWDAFHDLMAQGYDLQAPIAMTVIRLAGDSFRRSSDCWESSRSYSMQRRQGLKPWRIELTTSQAVFDKYFKANCILFA